MKQSIFYTDGACSGNPGYGGWAYVELVRCECGYKTEIESGNKNNTTNNEMELTAVFKALVKSYKQRTKKVTIYSDSAYVVNAISKQWLKNWYYNDWKTIDGKHIKNQKIWEKVYKLIYEKGLCVDMIKVKGHSDNPFNNLADEMAVKAKQEIMEV